MAVSPKSFDARKGSAFRRSAKPVSASGVALVIGGALLFGAVPSAAAAAGCPTGATLVAPGVCEVAFTQSGSFTPPAGVTTLEALLVGGGGASSVYYGGGGGDVRVVELASTGIVTVTVGAGGTFVDNGTNPGGASSVAQGTRTESAAGGIGAGDAGGTSGNGKVANGFGGSGAGASATDVNGGAGVVVSSLDSKLFKAVSSCFGGGGSGHTFPFDGLVATSASCGGGFFTGFVANTVTSDPNVWTANTGTVTNNLAAANSGGGAATFVDLDVPRKYTTAGRQGAAGQVVLRFDATVEAPVEKPKLAATGAETTSLGWAAALAVAGFGLVAFARRLRRG